MAAGAGVLARKSRIEIFGLWPQSALPCSRSSLPTLRPLPHGAVPDAPSTVPRSRRSRWTRWLWDAGAQCKVRVLGSLTVVLSYGRDLRGGKGVFYGTVLH